MQTATDLKSLAVSYIEAAGDKDYATVANLVADNVTFTGPFSKTATRTEYIAGLERMAPIWERSIVREAFVTGSKVCVVYDFVTKTVGALTCAEVLTFQGDRIANVELFFDPAKFAPATAALKPSSS